jgi:NADPH:quinone reductase
MQAAVLVAPGEVRMDTVPVPDPAEGQVRVRLEGCGVCGSNLPPWEGRPWFKYPLAPGELGHEGWGVVDALGPGSHSVREGDRVAVLSYHAYAQFDVASQSDVIPLPPELDDRPFPGEPLGCAMNVFKRSDIRAGQKVLVIGIGFLGALLVSLCARSGAEVIAISRRQFALDVARSLGAAHLIPMLDHSAIIQEVKEISSGRGCERVIEAVGQQWPLDLAGELTAERGRLMIAGYHQDGPRQVNLQLWNWRGIDVINAHERDPAVYIGGIRAAIEAVANGGLDPSPLYTHHFSLEDLPTAFNAMKDRPDKFLKALISL